jgi:hypothetical protein
MCKYEKMRAIIEDLGTRYHDIEIIITTEKISEDNEKRIYYELLSIATTAHLALCQAELSVSEFIGKKNSPCETEDKMDTKWDFAKSRELLIAKTKYAAMSEYVRLCNNEED